MRLVTGSGQIQLSRPPPSKCCGASGYPWIPDEVAAAVRISGLCQEETHTWRLNTAWSKVGGEQLQHVRVCSRAGDGRSAWRSLMRKQLSTTVFATLFLALTAGLAVGHTPPPAAGPSSVIKVAKQTTTPPRISATGRSHRSPTASTKGANVRGFCPPGQRRKPGQGSAFHC
jgi:hypothetical protein